MRLSRSILPVGLVALTLASCGPSKKISQCHRLAETLSPSKDIQIEFEKDLGEFAQQVAVTDSLEDFKVAAAQYTAALNKVHSKLNTSLIPQLKEVAISDERLQEYRNTYVQILVDTATQLNVAGEMMSMAAEVESEAGFAQVISGLHNETSMAQEKLQELSSQEVKLVEDINVYCGAQEATETKEATQDDIPEVPAEE